MIMAHPLIKIYVFICFLTNLLIYNAIMQSREMEVVIILNTPN